MFEEMVFLSSGLKVELSSPFKESKEKFLARNMIF
jgi:hypothetical protein